MTLVKQTSLGDQVSKKMSLWILILIIAIIVSIFFVSFLLSNQMFEKQVNSWVKVAPQQAITNLIDSDYFSINREVNFLKSTGLFSSFGITDNQKKLIASFGTNKFTNLNLIPIPDEAGVIWGYYFFKKDFYTFFSPFLISGGLFLAFILLLYFIIRWRIRSNLEAEFSHFNQFLNEIELLTEKIHEVYNEETNLSINTQGIYNTEQIIINRTISRLLEEIRKANKSLREAISASEQKRFEDELTRTALQVVHDIGSPLAVLEAIVQSASLMLPEDSRVAIRNAATKIRDIVNSLLKKAKRDLLSMDEGTLSQQLLLSLINQIVTEKRLQYRSTTQINIHFDFNNSSYGLFSYVKVADFSRIMSNLINNAVESIISTPGDISISLFENSDKAVIRISDNGKGIPSELISKLCRLGMTYGKSDGHGLGLFHAKTTIGNWGGDLELESQVGKGTTVSIHLPKSKAPAWFLPEIKIFKDQTVVIIDDDESIHSIWKERFKQFQSENKQDINLLHFYSPEDLMKWERSNVSKHSNMIYLCDYEFIGSNENGIDLITKLRLNYSTTLVTSRFYMDDVIMGCEFSGLKLLPKDMANLIPIVAFN